MRSSGGRREWWGSGIAAGVLALGLLAAPSVQAQCGIQLTSPGNGEQIPADECFTVTWSYQGNCTGGIVQVYLWSDCLGAWRLQDSGACMGGPPVSAVNYPATSISIDVENLPPGGAILEVRWVGNSGGPTLTSQTSNFTLVPKIAFHAACGAGQVGQKLCFHTTAPGLWQGHSSLVLASLTGATGQAAVGPNCVLNLDVDLFTYLVVGDPNTSVVWNLPCSPFDMMGMTKGFMVPNNPLLVGTPFWVTGVIFDPSTSLLSGCASMTHAYQLF